MRKVIIEKIKEYCEELKVINMQQQPNPTFLTIEKYICYLNNGQTIIREKILKNNKDGSAAVVLPITEEGDVILAIEPRVFTQKTVDIGLPAGYIEENEEPSISAVRELEEETGYTSSELKFLGSYYQDQGCSGANNYYYLATNCRKIKDQQLDEGEFIKYILVTFEEAEELIEMGYITGLNSIYTIEKAKQYIKER